jgi:hypothetical protein
MTETQLQNRHNTLASPDWSAYRGITGPTQFSVQKSRQCANAVVEPPGQREATRTFAHIGAAVGGYVALSSSPRAIISGPLETLMTTKPRRVRRKGRDWSRISSRVTDPVWAEAIRCLLHDTLSRAANFRATRQLTLMRMSAGIKHRTYVPDDAVTALVRRLRPWIKWGLLELWVAGRRIS